MSVGSHNFGAIIRKFEEQGVIVQAQAPGALSISVPERAPNGLTGDELANQFSEKLNQYITNGASLVGAVQIHYTVRRSDDP